MYLSYEDFEKCMNEIISLVKASGKKYDYICGIERGGLIPAAVLSYRLGLELITISVDGLYIPGKTRVECSSRVSSILNSGKPILMVDEIMESGGTAEKIDKLYKRNFDWAVCVCDPRAAHLKKPNSIHYYGIAIPIDKRQEVSFWWLHARKAG